MENSGHLVPFIPRKRTTIADKLQDYCDILLDDATGVTWDLYRPDQRDKLELKVRLALYDKSVRLIDGIADNVSLSETDHGILF